MTRTILLALVIAPLLGACASMPSEADLRIALVRACDNPRDSTPWMIPAIWDDGDTYKLESQFRPDGVLIYGYNGNIYDNGKWSLTGNHLHIDTNKHYADYEGVFDGQTGSGTMSNEPGNAGKWSMARDCEG